MVRDVQMVQAVQNVQAVKTWFNKLAPYLIRGSTVQGLNAAQKLKAWSE
jgi:hypothetical protein